MHRLLTGVFLATLAWTAGPAVAAPAPFYAEEAKLVAARAEAFDGFGRAVAIDGLTSVVGAWQEDPDRGRGPLEDAGSAYVFALEGMEWRHQAKLTAIDAEPEDHFGAAVALDGDTIVVGAPGGDADRSRDAPGDAGSAYVFVRHGRSWRQQARLTSPSPGVGGQFGHAVALFEDMLVIGAPLEALDQDSGRIENAGAAYVFVRRGSTWELQARLIAVDAEAGDRLGWSVALGEGTVVVGANGEDADLGEGPTANAGSAYVFVRSGVAWRQQAKLVAQDGGWGDGFGASVAISGRRVVVGANMQDPDLGRGPIWNAGSAYVFVRSGAAWRQQAKLVASEPEAEDYFGTSVSMDGDRIVVGADPRSRFKFAGLAFVFTHNGSAWIQQAQLESPDAVPPFGAGEPDRFGFSVAISEDRALVGAWKHTLRRVDEPRRNGLGPSMACEGAIAVDAARQAGSRQDGPIIQAGSAYLFNLGGNTWNPRADLDRRRDVGAPVRLLPLA